MKNVAILINGASGKVVDFVSEKFSQIAVTPSAKDIIVAVVQRPGTFVSSNQD